MMILFPNNPKYKKKFVGKKAFVFEKNKVSKPFFGDLSLITLKPGNISNYQIESLRRFLRRSFKKRSQILIKVFPALPITKKPNEIRLGRGKGNIAFWSFYINKGSILVEIKGADYKIGKNVLNKLKLKLPIKTFFFNQHFR